MKMTQLWRLIPPVTYETPMKKNGELGFFLPKRDEEGCSSSNLGGDWHLVYVEGMILARLPIWAPWLEASYNPSSKNQEILKLR